MSCGLEFYIFTELLQYMVCIDAVNANSIFRINCWFRENTQFRGTQRKARDIVIQNIICSSELARMCGISYISQLGSVKNTRLAARNPILRRILTARSTNKKDLSTSKETF